MLAGAGGRNAVIALLVASAAVRAQPSPDQGATTQSADPGAQDPEPPKPPVSVTEAPAVPPATAPAVPPASPRPDTAIPVPAAPPRSTVFAGPLRITANGGLPELVGLGIGIAPRGGRWRVGIDLGTLGVVPMSAAVLYVQRAIFRRGPFVLGVALYGGTLKGDLDSQSGDSLMSRFTAGPRLVFELGPPHGWGLVLEGGVAGLWDKPFGRLVGEKVLPSFAVRVARTFGR